MAVDQINNTVFNLPESTIMSKRKLCMFWLLAKAGRAKFIEMHEPNLDYRAFIWRDKIYFY